MKKGLKKKLINFNNKANKKIEIIEIKVKEKVRNIYKRIKNFLNLYKLIVIITTIVVIIFVSIFYVKLWKEPTKYTANMYIQKYDSKKQVGKQINKVDYKNNVSYSLNYPKTGNRVIDTHIKLTVDSLKHDFKKKYSKKNDGKTYYELIDYESYLAIDDNMSIVLKEEAKENSKQLYYKTHTFNYSLKTGILLREKDIFEGNYKSVIRKNVIKYLKDNYKNKLVKNYDKLLNNNYDYKYAINDYSVKIYFDSNEIVKNNKIICVEIPYSEFKGNTVTVSTSDVSGKEIIVNNIKLSINAKTKGRKSKFKLSNEFTKKDLTLYTTHTINLYDKDSAKSEIIEYISAGEKVQLLSTGEYGFSKIKYNNKTGYALTDYLDKKKKDIGNFYNTYIKAYAIENAYVYEKPSTSSKKVGVLKDGERVMIFQISNNGWNQIIYKGEKRYILSCYLSYFDKKLTNNLKVNPQRDISNSKPLIAVTFDGGPNQKVTKQLIKTLFKYDSVGTFFDIGSKMYEYPDVVKLEEAYGNEVGSLGFSNVDWKNLNNERIKFEVSNSEMAFNEILGHNPTIFRPPYGNTNKTINNIVNYPLITWNIDSKDTKYLDSKKIINDLKKEEFYGNNIILFHSSGDYTVEALEYLLKELTSKGYQFVTITELFSYNNSVLKKNNVYNVVVN